MKHRFKTSVMSLILVSASAISAIAAQTGAVEGVITWQFNESIGTKGDVHAHVILFPKRLKRLIGVKDEPLRTAVGSGIIGPDEEALGLRGANADGFGKVAVDDVPAGSYIALIISENTTRDITKDLTADDLDMISTYFASKAALAMFLRSPFLKLHKHSFERIQVNPGKTAHFNHDFGNTFI